MRHNKRAFTIVELVIVIAILAILAAVLIPTFVNLTKKANESNTMQLVKNMNTALKADMPDGKHPTMQSALDAANAFGYDLEKINKSKTDNEILWDSANDCFVYMKDGEAQYVPDSNLTVSKEKMKTQPYMYWKIVSAESELTAALGGDYSVYLGYEAAGPITIAKKGIDVGANKNIDVTFTDPDTDYTVAIRTNGGALRVNAPKATVYHYDKADMVVIEAVAGSSYHELGTVVGNMEIHKGRIELASGADVNTIFVSSKSAGDVKVDVVNGAKIGTVAPTTESAKADIEASATIPSDAKTEAIVAPNNDFAGGLGSEQSPYLIANGTQFANMNKLASEMNEGKPYYFKQIADIVVTTTYKANGFAGGYDGSNYKIVANLPDGKYTSLFSANQTTGFVTFKNMNIVMSNVGVNLLACADWGTDYGATFDNITFDSTEPVVKVNCTNFGFILFDALYTKGDNNPTYTFSNITNNVNLQNESTCTGFIVGSGPCFNTKTTVKYINCVNNGTITGASSVGFLYGNSAYIESVEDTQSVIEVEGCKNNSVLSSTKDSATVAFAPKMEALNERYQSAVGGSFLTTNYFAGKNFTVNQNGSAFTINTDDTAVNYKLAFNVGATYWTTSGKDWTDSDVALIKDGKHKGTWDVSNGKKYLIDLPVDAAASGTLTGSFKAYDKRTAEANGITVNEFTDGYAIVVKDNVTYLVFDVSGNTYIDCTVSLLVYAYDTNANLLGIKNVK